jgi:hypothetical protein
MSATVRLEPAQIAELAALIVQGLRERPGTADTGGLVDAQTLANVLGWTAGAVRSHAAELGAVRLGNGPRGRLRFDVQTALDRLSVCSASDRSQTGADKSRTPASTGRTAVTRRRRRTLGSDGGTRMLSVRGTRSAI